MLFRTNNYLRTIENKLKTPINPGIILYSYVERTLYEEKIFMIKGNNIKDGF